MVLPVFSYTIYHSPSAYIGTVLLRRIMGVLEGVELVRKPILVPRSMGVLVSEMLGGKESRNAASYNREDCARWASRYGIPLNYPEPSVFHQRSRVWANARLEREELPARAFYAADPECRDAFDNALFEAAWVEGRDVNDEKTILWAADRADIDGEDLLDRIKTGAGATEAWGALEEFLTAECPGVPTVLVNGERFFGKDRVDWILKRCKELTTAQDEADARRQP